MDPSYMCAFTTNSRSTFHKVKKKNETYLGIGGVEVGEHGARLQQREQREGITEAQLVQHAAPEEPPQTVTECTHTAH